MRLRSTGKTRVLLTSPLSDFSLTLFCQLDPSFPKLRSDVWRAFTIFVAPLSHFDYLREDEDDFYKKVDPKDVLNPKQIIASVTLSDKLALDEAIRDRKNQDAYLKGNKPDKMRRQRFGSWLNFDHRRDKKREQDTRSLNLNDGRVNLLFEESESVDNSDDFETGTTTGAIPRLNELGKGSSNRQRVLGEELGGLTKSWNAGDGKTVPMDLEGTVQDPIPGLNLGRRYDTGLKFDRTRPALRFDRYSTAWIRPEIEPKKLKNGNLDTRPILEFDLGRTEAVRYLGGERYKSDSSISSINHDLSTVYSSDPIQREEEMKTGAELVYNHQTPLGEYSRQSRTSPAFRYMTTWQEVYDAFKLLTDDNKAQDISQAFFSLKHMKPAPPEEVLIEMANEAIEHAHQMMPIGLTNVIHTCAKLKFFHPPLLHNWEIQLKDNKVLEACTDLDITCLVYSFGVLNRIGRQRSMSTGNFEKGLDFDFIEKLALEAMHPMRLEHYTHSMLVNIFYGLSLLRYRKPEALNKFLAAICKEDVLPRLEIQNLSSVIYSIGYLKFWTPELTTRVVEEVTSRISEFDIGSLSNILWSLGNARYTNQELVGKIATICTEERHLRNCEEQDLTNIMYGVAMCKYRNPPVLAQYINEIMKPGRIAQMQDMALANLLSSFSALKYSNDHLLKAILSELSSPKRLKKLRNIVIANAFYALGQIKFRQPHYLNKLMDEIIDPDRLITFSEFDLCIIAYACGTIRIKDRKFIQSLMKEISKKERLTRYSIQNLATIINSCELLFYKDEELLSNVCQLLSQEDTLRRLTPNGISLATLGLCRLQFYDPSFFGEYLKLCTSPDMISTVRPNTLIDLMFGSMRAEVVNFSQFMAVIKEIRDPKILMNLMNFSFIRLATVASLIGLRDETFLSNLKKEILKEDRLRSLHPTEVRDLARALERMSFYDEKLCNALNFGPRQRGQSVGILAPGGLQQMEEDEKRKDIERRREEQNLDWSGRMRPTFYD